MKIVREIKGALHRLAFERLMMRRQALLRKSEIAKIRAELCEIKARRDYPLLWHESQPNVRDTFAKIQGAGFSLDAAVKVVMRSEGSA